MQLKIEDLTQQIRDEGREFATRHSDRLLTGEENDIQMAQLRSNLNSAIRAENELPPLSTYRKGLAARWELWIKRRCKRGSHWFTWGQANFNKATRRALNNVLTILIGMETNLSKLRADLEAKEGSLDLQARLLAIESQLAALESTLKAFLENNLEEIRREQLNRIDLLLNEQRVCVKQLAAQITEGSVVTDRVKRNLQLQLDEITTRLDAVSQGQKPTQGER